MSKPRSSSETALPDAACACTAPGCGSRMMSSVPASDRICNCSSNWSEASISAWYSTFGVISSSTTALEDLAFLGR